jgi:hypothetical protein
MPKPLRRPFEPAWLRLRLKLKPSTVVAEIANALKILRRYIWFNS